MTFNRAILVAILYPYCADRKAGLGWDENQVIAEAHRIADAILDFEEEDEPEPQG